MPQFDFTTYSSQIFWFLICFAALYTTVQFIVLPRIRSIISERKNVIDSDRDSAEKLNNKIEELQNTTNQLRAEASEKYQSRIDNTLKEAAKTREKNIEELKEKIDAISKKSRQELHDFIAKSHAQNESIIKSLVQNIKAKILG